MFKKILLIMFVVAILALSGCVKDLPPEPNPPGTEEGNIGGQAYHPGDPGDTIDAGYAPPWDVFEEDGDSIPVEIFTIMPEELTVVDHLLDDFPDGIISVDDGITDLFIDVTHMDGVIYNKGYIFINGIWEEFAFDDDPIEGTPWIEDSASYFWPTENLCHGPRYIVAYSCKKHDDTWKCGCDADGNCGKWMVQEFPVTATVCSSGQDFLCIGDDLYNCADTCWSYSETCDTYRTCSESEGACILPVNPRITDFTT